MKPLLARVNPEITWLVAATIWVVALLVPSFASARITANHNQTRL